MPTSIKYVAKMLAIPKIRVETTQFSALIPGLLDGRFDIVGDSIHWTLARSKVVEFCFPTYYYAEWLAVQKGNPKNIHNFADFKGKTIATQLGTNYAEWLGKIEGMNFVTAKDWQETIQDLVIGRVDGNHLRPAGTRRLLQGPSGLEGGARDRLRAAHLQESGRLQPLRLPNG